MKGFNNMDNKNHILDMDATLLAKKIKNKEISSVEATSTYIEHIKEINPKLNCLV